jgi:light-harvesting complex I chlorophyll a/b binding protein 1
MFKAVLLALALVASASAFAPIAGLSPTQRTPVATNAAVDSIISGAQEEVGGVWDPLGLGKDEAKLYRRRLVELKHGRICMLATVGILVQSFVHIPDPAFQSARPLQALSDFITKRPEGFLQVCLFIAFTEVTIGKQDPSKMPGDYWGDFGAAFVSSDPAEFRRKQVVELKNGRLAMLAWTGMVVGEGITGKGPMELLLHHDL